ncbi:MAG TPA: hypothetical protein V6D19_18235 [Stenomitos sp.]
MASHPDFAISFEQLQAALGCLDLSLESELALYRRYRLQSDEMDSSLESATSALLLEASADSRMDSVAIDTTLVPSPSPEDTGSTVGSELTLTELQPSEPSASTLEPEPTPEEAISEAQERDSAIDRALDRTDSDLMTLAYLEEEEPETLPEPYSAEITAEPEAFERFLDPSIEDYLESSEALLKHLDDSTIDPLSPSAAPPQKKWTLPLKGTLITVGLLALAGLAGIVLSQWSKLQKPQTTPISPTAPAQSVTPAGGSPAPTGTGLPSIPPSNPSSSGGTTASPTAQAIPGKSTSSPSPAPASSPSASPSAQNGARYYIVVAPYQDSASLEKARELVPDAFIDDKGGQSRIQLAQLDDLQQAQQLVNDLKKRGFSSTVLAQR